MSISDVADQNQLIVVLLGCCQLQLISHYLFSNDWKVSPFGVHWAIQYCWFSIGLVVVQLGAVLRPSIDHFLFIGEAFSRLIMNNADASFLFIRPVL